MATNSTTRGCCTKGLANRARIAQVLSGAGLVILIAFWAVVVVRVVVGLAAGGVDGARGTLHRMILSCTFWAELDRDPVAAVSKGYEGLILSLLILWALREIYAFARRRAGLN